MEKKVSLFDKKFVHFMWDDELEGKEVFASNDIYSLMDFVNYRRETDGLVKECGYSNCPFIAVKENRLYKFVYYDPNYEVKKAFNEGKTIQYYYGPDGEWVDCNHKPDWNLDTEYRVKPEEKEWIVYLSRGGYLTACREDIWEQAQKEQGAKTKLFVGSAVEASAWYEARQKFAPVIKAWEDGKMIQIRHTPNSDWVDLNGETPKWHTCYEYRIKPEEKKWRPYESSAEMIVDFIDRFKVNCPSYCEPLIWVKTKSNDARFLTTGFGKKVSVDGVRYSLDELFKYYVYLDGSPVGMDVEK